LPENRDTPGRKWSAKIENDAVEAYLQYITNGTLPPPKDMGTKVEVLDQRIENEPRLFMKVKLIAERHAITAPQVTPEELLDGFIKHVGSFSERNQIDYAVWREMGVKPEVLKQAGIGSGSKPKLAPDDPNRVRPYRPRREWSADEKAEYIAFYEEQGREAALARWGGTLGSISQRYYGFRAEARKAAGEPSQKPGRPKKADAGAA
jgi:hypothetical protein